MRGINAVVLGVILGPLSYLAGGQEPDMQDDWHEYSNKMYLFVMDAARQMDQSRDEALTDCQSRQGNLVSIETEDEMAFIKRRIKVQETIIGQESLNDQWWTSGVANNGEWVWDNAEMDIITISALKRKTVPARKSHHFLALQHSTEGWRLRTMPDNYKLRYICERPAVVTHEALRTTEERLLDRLLRQYDPDARGVAKSSDTMNVKIQFYLVRIHDLDERRQVLTTSGLIIADWVDLRLRWNITDYDNMSTIVVRANRLWLPELTIMNSADEQMLDAFERMRVQVHHNGSVHWELGGVFETTCDMDIAYFPFDSQSCTITIGTWAYYSAKMDLMPTASEPDLNDFHIHGEWEMLGSSVVKNSTALPCCGHRSYPFVEFTFHLSRRRMFYVINIIVPCSMLSALMLVMFWVPQHAGERVTGIVTMLLAFTVFLHMVSDIVPRTSLQIPVLVIHLTSTMSLGTLSVCLTILLMNMYHNSPEAPPPACIRQYLQRKAKHRICEGDTSNDLYYTGTITKENNGKKYHLHNSLKIDQKYSSPSGSISKYRSKRHAMEPEATDLTVLGSNLRENEYEREGICQTVLNGGDALRKPNHKVKVLRFANPAVDDCDPSLDAQNEPAVEIDKKQQIRHEWQEFVRLLDKIFFAFVTLIMVLTSFFLLLLPWIRSAS